MANPVVINPTLTLAGQAAAFNANNTGIALVIDGVSFGLAHYDPTGTEVALVSPVGARIPLAGGSRPTPYQLRMTSVWNADVGQAPVGEIGYWSGNTLVFVWSKADGSVAGYKTDGVPYVLFNDLAFAQVPPGSISFNIDPTESAALAALAAHEGAANAHPQYLARAAVAQDSGQLAWLGNAAGTVNDLVLTLQAAESELTGYAPGQRYQFVAVGTNTTAVTANIEGHGPIAVKKVGDNGLIDLEPGDIKAPAIYDLNFDGTYFQLGGGVGAGKAFQRYSFVASVAQTVFPGANTIGSNVVLRNGREITDYVSDGAKFTFNTPCNINDQVEILAFQPFKIANAYTKAEITALLQTASALPVGAMLPFPKGTVPPGFLEVDGSVQSTAVYPDLSAYLGTTFNTGGEGAGNFRLPESRGEFLRGWDHGRGVDVGRAIGSWQADDFKSHLHPYGSTAVLAGGAGASAMQAANLGATNTGAVGGTETRPRNLAVMWCIKAWNAPVNQGNIDIAALAAQVQKLSVNGPVVGAVRNGRMSVTVASVSATYTADEFVVENAATGATTRLIGLNKTINLSTVGAGGMDVGAAPVSGWVALYAIFNPVSAQVAILAKNATSVAQPEIYAGANMPAGYTSSALLSVVPTNGSGQFAIFEVMDRSVLYFRSIFSGVGINSLTLTSLSLAVPINAKTINMNASNTANAAGMCLCAVCPSAVGAGALGYTSFSGYAPSAVNVLAHFHDIPLLVPQTVYIAASGPLSATSFNSYGYTI